MSKAVGKHPTVGRLGRPGPWCRHTAEGERQNQALLQLYVRRGARSTFHRLLSRLIQEDQLMLFIETKGDELVSGGEAMPSKGTPVVPVRLPEDLQQTINAEIVLRNTWSRREPSTFSSFLRAAVNEFIRKRKASRGPRRQEETRGAVHPSDSRSTRSARKARWPDRQEGSDETNGARV